MKIATKTTLLYISPNLKNAPAFHQVTRQAQLIEKPAKIGPFFLSHSNGHFLESEKKKTRPPYPRVKDDILKHPLAKTLRAGV
jgi:hypothetical protein